MKKITTTLSLTAAAIFALTVALTVALIAALPVSAADKPTLLTSAIVSQKDAHITHYEGGDFHTYFYGDTPLTKGAITGVAVIKPNNEIHPAHQHPDEEYLMILEGSGTWTLNGKSQPAHTGDILFAAPNDLHGIYNNGDVPLKFVVVRYQAK
ncbi:cupin domain-containing protein [Pseudoalteromonas carrageenovora]|uniref:cupin domain-containing protein n=1 Tax=Pseudoalteromonas carrageenovora TaxID=227 RepID=UPI0026E2311B|nr:cupin domain-containing protein [Pseudoalteromonas carrageenovora]MDO6835540.1 cupin domain-containing protein [Pseudoalteromonas carrageenovora]